MRSALAVLLLVTAGCAPKKDDDRAECVAPGGCGAVLSTLGTGEAQVELIPDGEGGVYAALLGRGLGGIFCPTGQVCHGQLWRVGPDGSVMWKIEEKKSVDRPMLVDGGVAYRTGDGKLHGISPAGERVWEIEIDANPADGLQLVATPIASEIFVLGGGQAWRIHARSEERRVGKE